MSTGIADQELEVSKYTTLGKWRITAVIERQEFSTTFDVIEYGRSRDYRPYTMLDNLG